jgi:hypothetical protein
MKKIVTIVLLMAVSPVLHAQFSLGAKVGMTVSNYVNVTSESKASVSYKAGLSAMYMFSRFGVEAGVYIKEAGTAYTQGALSPKNSMDGSQVYMSIKSGYIDVPVSLVYKYPVLENVQITFNAGGYIAFGHGGAGKIMHSKGSFNMDAFDDFNHKNGRDFADFTVKGGNKLDFGLVAGVGLDISRFNISANYDLGIANVYKMYPVTKDKNIKNRIFWIALGYNFNL